ncbi:hypothetical protein FACS1894139_04590 [Planctomycetales bacterium]|nr:hypothetical protein FACS1894107_09130 [Planctomycetales bacterium]GHS99048.1 hypothetical protein FACS1894108_08310 [Planctomycetales bacterium]GHT03693.1 hypothetical protein FACS1894139_04590 [Planctomycetales bacterium]
MPLAIDDAFTIEKLDEDVGDFAASDVCPFSHIPNIATRQILDDVAAGRGLRGAFTSIEALMKDLNA